MIPFIEVEVIFITSNRDCEMNIFNDPPFNLECIV